jgi:hypothetical protein
MRMDAGTQREDLRLGQQYAGVFGLLAVALALRAHLRFMLNLLLHNQQQ